MNTTNSRRAWRGAILAASAAMLVTLVGWRIVLGYAHRLELPQALLADEVAGAVVYERGGQVLARVRSDGKLSIPVALTDVPSVVIDTLLVAEDKRFYSHGGIDVLATFRAFSQMVRAGRVVSGASTLTQQLARSTFERPRTLAGKLHELALALRIEAQLDKDQILLAYLNRIEFGPNLVGIGAAAHAYFAKPVSALSLSEAATLVGIPRGPTLYNPARASSPIKRRRDRILRRLAGHRSELASAVDRALLMPIELQASLTWPGAFHWVRRIASQDGQARVHTTLDATLQRRVETLVRAAVPANKSSAPTAAAVLVADNRTGDVLAYVGSPRYHAPEAGGQNDGVIALRQPGSTLKPFVYASAMKRLSYTAATLLPDIPLEFRERGQVYVPRNYDGRFRGPVRLREALANSLNVPAVHTAARLGEAQLLADLRAYGFASLTREPEHYGVALALGNGEVQLEELVAAYAGLARGGSYRPLRLTLEEEPQVERRVMPEAIAVIIADMLRDPRARAGSFGRHGALEFPFPVAVKTGTSKGARDNWAIGFSERVTVGVWVGNFDGKPIASGSGAKAAGPLFHSVMNAADRWQSDEEQTTGLAGATAGPRHHQASPGDIGAQRVTVCAQSGLLPNAHCPSKVHEWFVPGTEPREVDTMHVEVAVLHGALAPSCPAAERRVVERYAPEYARWAAEAGRPTLPQTVLTDCAHERGNVTAGQPAVTFPREGAVYRRVADEPVARQQLVFRATAAGAERLTYVVNGREFRTVEPPFDVEWPLLPGEHQVYVVTERGLRGSAISFAVE